MPKKKEEHITETERKRRELEDAVAEVDAFLFGRYKSIYLLDSWAKIKKHLLAE